MLGRLGRWAVAVACAVASSSALAHGQWVKSGTRSLTLCTGGALIACAQVMMTTRLLSNGYGESILGFRNLQGERPEDTTNGSLLTGVSMVSTTSLWPGDKGSYQLQQPTVVGTVQGDGGGSPGWNMITYERLGVIATSAGTVVTDPVYGPISTITGIGGCTYFGQRFQYSNRVVQALPSYSTCTSSGYPGMLTLQYGGYHLASPDYFDDISISFRSHPDPTGGLLQACSIRSWGPGMPLCTVVEDVFVGDSFNDPLVTPEPGTLLLVSTGLAGIGAAVRRRRRR